MHIIQLCPNTIVLGIGCFPNHQTTQRRSQNSSQLRPSLISVLFRLQLFLRKGFVDDLKISRYYLFVEKREIKSTFDTDKKTEKRDKKDVKDDEKEHVASKKYF